MQRKANGCGASRKSYRGNLSNAHDSLGDHITQTSYTVIGHSLCVCRLWPGATTRPIGRAGRRRYMSASATAAKTAP